MFQISQTPLERLNLCKDLASSKAGAFNSFEGWARDHNEGKTVLELEYEAYEPLCRKEAQKIFQEVQERFDVIAAKCVHRTGKLQIGDMAVWVGVTAAHRDDSFRACRYIIDEVKSRLPIWKKEYYGDGNSDWIICPSCVQNKIPAIHEESIS